MICKTCSCDPHGIQRDKREGERERKREREREREIQRERKRERQRERQRDSDSLEMTDDVPIVKECSNMMQQQKQVRHTQD